MKRECDVDNMIAAKHAKPTARTRGAIKVEYTVINEFIANESVTYHCWTENYEDGKANAYINSTCVPSTVRITFIPCDSKEQYQREHRADTPVDRRWVNGFMAAGFHSGLITLRDLKIECLSAYRTINEKRMTRAQESQLERRLTKLCEQE